MTHSEKPPPFWSTLQLDFAQNEHNVKGKLVVTAYRLAHWLRCKNKATFYLGLPYLLSYRVLIEWVLGVELPPLLRIGPGFALNHGQGLVVNNEAVIGSHCRLRQGVTIGNKSPEGGSPVLGNHVEVGANAIILGEITIGDHAKIGAASVVTKDVPPGAIVVGNPAKVLEHRQ